MQVSNAQVAVFRRLLAYFSLFVTVSCALPHTLVAQTGAGRVIGTVTDESGAAIADATVIITNAQTNVHWETTSNSDGNYQLLNLPIGNYSVTAEHAGFEKAVTPAQALEINQSLRIDLRLKVGSVAETITVEALAAQVETVSPTIGGTVTGDTIQNLPLNGRNTLDLALTQPGVTPAAGTTLPPVAGVPSGEFTIAGGRDNAVTYLLDGGDNTSVTYGVPVMNPNPDTIAEFRILENNYTAEYGRSAGGVVSVVTKSGTNEFHGSAYDYFRNTDLNANNFFNKDTTTPQPRPILNRNQFGGTVGGPILKDRFFFFFGYQGQRQNSVIVGDTVTVFTPAQLNGNFSGGGTPGNCPNANAGVAAFLLANPYYQSNPAMAGCAMIDPTKIDPVAQKYVGNNLLPVSSTGLLTPNGPALDNRNEYLGKLDYNPSLHDQISFTAASFDNPQQYPFLVGAYAPNVPGYPGASNFTNYFGTVSWVHTFSGTTLNEVHVTAQHDNNNLNNPAKQLPSPNALGVNITPDQTTGPPQIVFNNSGAQIGFNLNGPAKYADTTYLFADTFSWTHGRHTMKAGASVGFIQNNAYFSYAVDGQFYFYGSNTGSDLADFLIGAPEYFDQYPKGYSAVRSQQYAGFVQDEWKVTPRLVLTLGLRYEYTTPKSDPENRNYMIIPGDQSVKFPNAPLGLVFPGDPGAPSKGVNFPDYNNWAPRFGFAWDPFGDGKTSVRGGGGIFYDVLLAQDNQYQNGTPPFYSAAAFALPLSADGPNTSLSNPYGTAEVINPFPSEPPTSSLNFATAGFLPFGPASVFINPRLRTPYVYQYNLSVQRQLANGLAAEIGYVGSSSHKLVALYDSDPFLIGTTNRILNQQPALVAAQETPYGNMPSTFGNVANANYNGMLASLTKRMGDWHSIGQTFFTVSYTWAHSIDDADGFARNSSSVSYYNYGLFRASGDSDIRNRFVLSGGWQLPFEHLWSNGPKRLTNGWTLYPIFFAQSGLPMDVNEGLAVDGVTPGPSGDGDQNLVRPNWTGGNPQSLNPHNVRTFVVDGQTITGNFAFNPTGLYTPSCYFLPNSRTPNPNPPGTPGGCSEATYGTLPRNFFRGPGRVNFDLSLEKITPITERVQLTFRAELFNVVNHTEWQSSNTSTPIASPQLGQITSTYDPRIGQLSLRISF